MRRLETIGRFNVKTGWAWAVRWPAQAVLSPNAAKLGCRAARSARAE